MLRVVFTLTLLYSHAIALNELSEGDASGEVSVHLVDGQLWVSDCWACHLRWVDTIIGILWYQVSM